MIKALILISSLLLFATATRAENFAFVGRTQNTADVPNTSITLATPEGIQDGDVMLVFIASYNSTPTAPSGWTSLGSRSNSNSDVGAAVMKAWHTGDPTSYTFGNVNWPKAVMRVYRGVTGVDSANFAASGSNASWLVIPALSATTAANDPYIAFFVSDNATTISGPSDLSDQTADHTQWGSFEGDKVIVNQGAEPPAETAVLSSGQGNWIGFVITLANHPANLTFVGRTQNTANAPQTSITLSTPAGIQNGDVMLAFIASYNSVPTAPSGWTAIGSRSNSNSDVGAAFLKVWQTGNPISYTFGNTNWPKAIMRVYRGVTGVDSANFAASGGGASSLTLPALSATTAANDPYIAFLVSDNATAISGPSDLANQVADHTQWGSFDGDKLVASQGAAPPAESANLSSGTGNWVGLAVTLGNTPSPALLPYGNIPPPPGQSWYVTLNDEFANDTPGGPTNGINTALWNAGPGGGWIGCTPPNNDVLGNSGGSCDPYYGNAFDGTAVPSAPYIGIKPGVGLVVQDLNNYREADQGNAFPDQDWMSLQNWGKWSQRFGYFEISAKMPTDNHGEGDGLHSDIWLVPVNRTQWCYCAHSDEVDIAENDLGLQTTNNVHWNIWDTSSNGSYYNATSVAYPYNAGDLSTAFHRYAVYWRNDGAHGTFQVYFDGQPVGPPVAVHDSLWDAGVYIFLGWLQQVGLGAFYGGANVDAATSNHNPLIIQYVRVWQSH